MDNDPTDKISSYIDELTERFKFPKLNLRLVGRIEDSGRRGGAGDCLL